jgi:predicted MPP superfamily phosphohydrolase
MTAPVEWLGSLGLFVGLALVGAVLLRVFFPSITAHRGARRSMLVGLGAVTGAHGAWALDAGRSSQAGMVVSCVVVVVLGFVVASLVPAAAVHRSLKALLLRRAATDSPPSGTTMLSRRRLVSAAAAMVPATSVATALRGFAAGKVDDVSCPRLRVDIASLPPGLDGMTLLHLSDLHLGTARDLHDLERLLARVDDAGRRPDLVVLTGDVADDLRQLEPALAMVRGFGARLGALACLGNHEYLRDIGRTRPIYERSQIPLLVDRGVLLDAGTTALYVAGIDDPVSLDLDIRPALRGSVERAMRDAPAGVFSLLLAHRPEAFDAAYDARVGLTLSGHTHGGQIGFNGKSAFEPMWPDGYLWGAYRRGGSRLYTTSGFGNWFPFRLGCPAEAPLIELVATPRSSLGRLSVASRRGHLQTS